MTRKLNNAFLTIRNALTLRNLLAFLCAVALVAVVIKGFQIAQKTEQVRQADAFYEQNRRISAEVAYSSALSNTVIRYREDHIRERLAELAPVTRLREELLKSKSELLTASGNADFDTFLTAYETYDLFRRRSVEGDFSAEYLELSERYELARLINGGFAAFRAEFEHGLTANLDNSAYDDESSKWSLLRIPAIFFSEGLRTAAGNETSVQPSAASAESSKTQTLNALFRSYDQRKLKKLAAAGQYEDMLDEARSTIEAYRQHDADAPWVLRQAEETTDTILRKDFEAEAYAVFASHARSFSDFASQTGVTSDLATWIGARIEQLMNQARSLIAENKFADAIALYRSLGSYADTSTQISQTERAWTEAEPLRILQLADASHTYSHAVSGKNRFDADLYVAATDENGTLYFATRKGDSTTVDRDSQTMLNAADIQGLRIEESLSTDAAPVVLIESASMSRQAVYTALILQNRSFYPIFQVEADGYTIENGGRTLRADHPADTEEEGVSAVYERSDDAFYFVAFEGGPLDIGQESPVQYPQQKVRALLTVLQSASSEALAQTSDGSQILLRGDFDVEPGTYEVTGTFREDYADIEQEQAIDGQAAEDNPATGDPTPTDVPDTGMTEEDPDAQAGSDPASTDPESAAAPDSPAADTEIEPARSFVSVPVFAVEKIE